MTAQLKPTTQNFQEEARRSAAIEYIKRALGQGQSLAKSILDTANFDDGTIIAFTPGALEDTQAIKFEAGHFPQPLQMITVLGHQVPASPVLNSDRQLAKFISSQLERGDTCIVEDTLAQPDDARLQTASPRVVLCGPEVYRLLVRTDRRGERIGDVLRKARGFPSIGAAGQMKPETVSSLLALGKASKTDLKTFASEVDSLFVGAYDGEGYLVWRSS